MITLWWLCAALGAPNGAGLDPASEAGWVEVVARSTNPTSARWTAAEATPHWQAACNAGRKAACSVLEGASVRDALFAACLVDESTRLPLAEVVDPVACLGRYWRAEAREPELAFSGFRELCDRGLSRACAEVARAHADGIGTFTSRRRARSMAEPLCADGVGAACVVLGRLDVANRPRRAGEAFDQASALGEAGAIWEKVPVVAMVEAADRLSREACDAGHPAACVAIAQKVSFDEPQRAQELVSRACDLGSADGCLRDALTKYEQEVISKREVQSRLESLCLELDDACMYAGFLGFGGDVRAFFPGHYPDTEKQRITGQIVPFARDCFRDFRDRNPTWKKEVELDLLMWVDEEGTVRGALPDADADREYQKCVVEHSLGVISKHLPSGGAALVEDHMTFGMEADVVVSTFKGASGSKQVEDLEVLAYEEWTGPLNDCYMDNGGSAWDDVFTWIYGEVEKGGAFIGTRLIESSGDEPTDACVLDLLQGIEMGKTYRYTEKVRIYVRFNVVYRAPREKGRNHGKAADPDTYMYGDGEIPPDRDF